MIIGFLKSLGIDNAGCNVDWILSIVSDSGPISFWSVCSSLFITLFCTIGVENFCTRWPCVSVTKRYPSFEIATSFGNLKCPSSLPIWPNMDNEVPNSLYWIIRLFL